MVYAKQIYPYGQPLGTVGQMRKNNTAREQYKPDKVRCLLIAEGLPDSLDRFFYHPNVGRADYLFLGVMQVLYPKLKGEFLAARRSAALKEGMLRRFQDDGFYFLDILDAPPQKNFRHPAPGVREFLSCVRLVADWQTPIMLIKATTFDRVYGPLKEAGYEKVFGKPIPFPSQGWQHRFCEVFRRALQETGVSWAVG